MFTCEAVGLLPEGCFDLVFIDAGHSYEITKFNIIHYAPLLRDGGLLCGHDYRPGDGMASKAIDELLPGRKVLRGGVVWWAVKEMGWMTETERENLNAPCYTVMAT